MAAIAALAQPLPRTPERLAIEHTTPSEAARRLRTWVSASQPSFLLFKHGELVGMTVGELPGRELSRLVQRLIH